MASYTPEQLAVLKAENLGPTSTAVVVVFTVLSFICVVLRFVTRIYFTRNVGLEDYFIALSMCFSICMAACQIEQANWGNGRHVMFLNLVQAGMILKYLYFSILAYCISLTLTKISILLQYRRIFTLRENRTSIYIVMGICVAYGIESVLTGTFTCIPVDAFWDLMKKPTAKCLNENALYYANAGLNVATDLMVAVLPVRAIWGLQMARKQKIALLCILTIGWFVCIVSILRLNALVVLARHPEDNTWYSTATAYWSAIEVNLAIVCASTPALKPLVARVIPRFASKFGSNESNSKGTKESTKSSSKDRKSFVELKGKSSSSTMSDEDVELGNADFSAPPTIVHPGTAVQNIRVTKNFEQHFEDVERISESSSQKDLVHKFPRAFGTGNRR